MSKFLLFLIVAVLPLLVSHGYKIEPRIINGLRSSPEKYPFFVQLEGTKSDVQSNGVACCGATLLSDRWIVTAAHCVEQETDQFVAQFGIDRNGMYYIEKKIERSNIHTFPEYNKSDVHFSGHDIALIKLSKPIELSAKIQPVKLPTDCGEDISKFIHAFAVGTGETERWSDGLLRETKLVTLPSDQCPTPTGNMADIRASIYTRSTSTLGSTAKGDSGGPLLRFTDKTLIGVISLRYNDHGSVTEPRIQLSTNIHYYFDWIAELTGIDLPKCDSLHE